MPRVGLMKGMGLNHARKAYGVYVCVYGHTYSKSMDQPGEVASPARGQLNRKK